MLISPHLSQTFLAPLFFATTTRNHP